MTSVFLLISLQILHNMEFVLILVKVSVLPHANGTTLLLQST